MKHYYNEHDSYAAEFLKNLADGGEIPSGTIDSRSIVDVTADDLVGYRQCHFFAGIGGWCEALRLAGWPDEEEVWTGSCPCQPFSAAGKRKGAADERHLWPEFRRLIAECRPATVFGEQVASSDGREWLAGVRVDLEALGYGVGAADLCAASQGAPHIRQRLYWVADSSGAGLARRTLESSRPQRAAVERGGGARRLVHAEIDGRDEGRSESDGRDAGATGTPDRVGDATALRRARSDWTPEQESGAWSRCVVIPCRDGKARRVSSEPGDEPLAHGLPRSVGPAGAWSSRLEYLAAKTELRAAKRNRVGRLRGYGNAIVPQVAAMFITAFREAIACTTTTT